MSALRFQNLPCLAPVPHDASFEIDQDKVAAEAALDGLYVVRTSVSAGRLRAEDTVLSYKRLSQVERAFRTLKSLDLEVRPIRHRRGRAHIILRAGGLLR